MRNKTSVLLLLLFSLITSCHDSDDDDCIDESKISIGACPLNVAPVCGCDGKTYVNSCVAEHAGVTHWTNGDCK